MRRRVLTQQFRGISTKQQKQQQQQQIRRRNTITIEEELTKNYIKNKTKVARLTGYPVDTVLSTEYVEIVEKLGLQNRLEKTKKLEKKRPRRGVKVWRGKPVKTHLNWIEEKDIKEINWGTEKEQEAYKERLRKTKFTLIDYNIEEQRKKIEEEQGEPFYNYEGKTEEEIFNKAIETYMNEFALLGAIKTEVEHRRQNSKRAPVENVIPKDEKEEIQRIANEIEQKAQQHESRQIDELAIIRTYTERALEEVENWRRENPHNHNLHNVEKDSKINKLRLHMMGTLNKIQNILTQNGKAFISEISLENHRKMMAEQKGSIKKIEQTTIDALQNHFKGLEHASEKQIEQMAKGLERLTPRISANAHKQMLLDIKTKLSQKQIKVKENALAKKIFPYLMPSLGEEDTKPFRTRVQKAEEEKERVYEEAGLGKEEKSLNLISGLNESAEAQHKLDMLEFSTHHARRPLNPLSVRDEFATMPDSTTPLPSKLVDSVMNTNKKKHNYELFLNVLDRMITQPGGKKFEQTTINIFRSKKFKDMLEAPSNVQYTSYGKIQPILKNIFYPYLLKAYEPKKKGKRPVDLRVNRIRLGEDQHLYKLPPSKMHLYNLTTTAHGSRKTAKARVQIKPGSGQFFFNGKRNLPEYITWRHCRLSILNVLQAVNATAAFDIVVKVAGGGQSGQTQAIILALSRALVRFNHNYVHNLKRMNYLLSDSRQKEKKKAGRPRARKGHQWKRR